MLEHVARFAPALRDPENSALATIVAVKGSSPRTPGTSLSVHRDGTTVGSLSGGCLEAAVVHEALTALDERTARLLRFDDAETSLGLGLTCGGEVTVLVEPATHLEALGPQLLADDGAAPLALVRLLPAHGVDGSEPVDVIATALVDPAGPLPEEVTGHLDPCSLADLRAAVAAGTTGSWLAEPEHRCPVRVFLESRLPAPRLNLYGAGDHAAALATIAGALGWRVTVCDHRPLFTTRARHPDAHEVVVEREGKHVRRELETGALDARSAVVVLSHDADVDVAVLRPALAADLAYVGAMGSRRTHDRRVADLRSVGVSERELAALHSPVGLAIGAVTPQEFAVSVMAEIVSEIRLGSARGSLRSSAGPVQRARAGGGPAFPTARTTLPEEVAPWT